VWGLRQLRADRGCAGLAFDLINFFFPDSARLAPIWFFFLSRVWDVKSYIIAESWIVELTVMYGPDRWDLTVSAF
jgi:hypothetical protein